MDKHHYIAPKARGPVADPKLFRPDWTTGTPRDPALLWLDKNENTDPEMAKLANRVLSEIDQTAIGTYPECAPLYHKLGAYLGIGADHLLLTAGSDGAIRSVFEAFIDPGDVVIHPVPTFAMYAVYSAMYGAKVIPLEYHPSDQGPSLPVEEVLEMIARSRPKLVCLPNPDSPTGTVFVPDQLRRIIEAAGEAGALILIDEAYYPFYAHTIIPWVDEYQNLVVTQTFAKAWGLSGLRIGFAASCPQVARLLHKVRPMYEVNTVALAIMEKMLEHSDAMTASVKRLNAGKEFFLDAMQGLGLKVLKSHGNFLHVAFGAHASAVHEHLKNKVLYRLDFKEPCLKGFSRFSATTPERFNPLIECIRQTINGKQE
ncbi:MAG: aminotransferase class I/II-fold pyridoxal phosphate-dependent enzyme [Candidatus Omnitrophica bacterium]|nr:aminotransferase class I/II-fold pyridoxal phosphate-dependent enzyme [Candidatus Omnitrophota bacterium]